VSREKKLWQPGKPGPARTYAHCGEGSSATHKLEVFDRTLTVKGDNKQEVEEKNITTTE
jgi:hypothetical protein